MVDGLPLNELLLVVLLSDFFLGFQESFSIGIFFFFGSTVSVGSYERNSLTMALSCAGYSVPVRTRPR